MAEFLSPGIFIEEVNTSGQIVDSVGTSTMGTVGWTERGPINRATIVTSIDDFQRKFGEYTNDSRVPITVQAFFVNGGARAYVVRVVPTDSAKGESCISDQISNEALSPLGTGTGPQTIAGTLANIPVQKLSAVIQWRNNPVGTTLAEASTFSPLMTESTVGPFLATLANTPIVAGPINLNWSESNQANGLLTFGGNALNNETVTIGVKTYTFQSVLTNIDGNVLIGASASASINNLYSAIVLGAGAGVSYAAATVAHPTAGASVPVAATMVVFALVGGVAGNAIASTSTVTLGTFGSATLTGGTAPAVKIATLTGTTTVGGANAARISAASINRITGALSVTFAARVIGTSNGPIPLSFNVDYDAGGALQTVTDNGAGLFSVTTTGGTTVTGTINYATGALSATFTGGTDQPYAGNVVAVNYKHCMWAMTASNQGSWANRIAVRVSGNASSFTYGNQSVAGAGEFSKFDISVSLKNTVTGENEIKETYEEVVFSDVNDAVYFPDIINDNSDFIKVTDSGALNIPASFKGIDRNQVMGTGNGTQTLFVGVLANFPIVKTSPAITYTPVATGLRTLVADLNGNITGPGLDVTKTNILNYATGVFTLNFLTGTNAPATAATIDAAYISMPATSSIVYSFTGGTNGTLTGSTFDRGQFTSPVLSPLKKGMYALGAIDEVMQLCIPDFAGDTVVAGDQLDYADLRKDVFVILTTPRGMDSQAAADYRAITFNRKSKFAAMYWPWVKVTDPLNAAKTLTVPGLGWVAGVFARTDQTRNVGKAPGGTIDGALRFLTGLEINPDKGDRDLVYPLRINPFINTAQTGLAVWGVRTLSPTNDVLRYINAVRLFQFVEKSVFNSTFNFVFESINSNLYNQLKTSISGFLLNLYTTGHFAGNNPGQAFFVICDETNNPPQIANAGQVAVDIGIAPNRPGEFIRFRFGVKTLNS
jgi:phage tail sheath protein FI